MIYLALPLQIHALTPYVSIKGYRDKNFTGDIQMIKALTTNPLFVSKWGFRVDKFDNDSFILPSAIS